MSHTPGPWTVEQTPTRLMIHAHGRYIADAAGTSSTICDAEQRQANAHLIAAAPELLEALRAFVAWCDENDWGTMPKSLERKTKRILARCVRGCKPHPILTHERHTK